MFASLPMYDFPENREAHDHLWARIRDEIRDRGEDAPETLDRDTLYSDGWARRDLTLGQICNLPYRKMFVGKVTPIGAADYGLEGCAPGYYRSLFIVRLDDVSAQPEDLDGRPMAYNDALSQSGYGAVSSWALQEGFLLNPALQTGAHIDSVRAVAAGKADFATIDAQSFRVLQGFCPEIAQVRVIGVTPSSPGMTFITRKGRDPEVFRMAIRSAIKALSSTDRDILGLRGIVTLPAEAYDPNLPPPPQYWSQRRGHL